MHTNMNQLESDFLYCESIIQRHSKRFYQAFSRLPEKKAKAIYAIYAFCRIADDCVDENPNPQEQQQALSQFKLELDLFSRNEELDLPLWRALRHVFNNYDMSLEPFYDQLTGQARDIAFKSPETLEELEDYSYYVAGSVGLMLLPVIASENASKLMSSAIELGIAMQITNILRDIGEDLYDHQRIYLPISEMERFNYRVDDLRAGVINDAFICLWEDLALRAEGLYDNFMQRIDLFDADSKLPVSLSAQYYRGILDLVRESGYTSLARPVSFHKSMKLEPVVSSNQ
ncbi:phytoene/squalene synthase family protein [Oceanobacillus sp. CAU 1775]